MKAALVQFSEIANDLKREECALVFDISLSMVFGIDCRNSVMFYWVDLG
jgi:hypothetical protein